MSISSSEPELVEYPVHPGSNAVVVSVESELHYWAVEYSHGLCSREEGLMVFSRNMPEEAIALRLSGMD